MRFRRLLLGTAAATLTATAAMAADPIIYTPAPPPYYAPPAAIAFDWSGFYAGAHLIRPIGAPFILFGGQAGFNIQRGSLVFGFEARGGIVPGSYFVGAGGKAGIALGGRGNFLVYGTAAAGFAPAGPGFYWVAGGGAAVGLGSRVSVFAEFDVLGAGGGCCAYGLVGGLNFHFGN